MPVAWGTAAEVGGNWSATVSAMMNMAGNAGGALYGLMAGLVLQGFTTTGMQCSTWARCFIGGVSRCGWRLIR